MLDEAYLGLSSTGIDGNRFRFVKYGWEGFFQRKRGSAEMSFQRGEKTYGCCTVARLTPFCKALQSNKQKNGHLVSIHPSRIIFR